MIKRSFFGALLAETEAESPYAEYDGKDLKRFGRRFRRRNEPIPTALKEQGLVVSAIKKLRRDIPDSEKIHYIHDYKYGGRSDNTIIGPSAVSVSAGHELGHVKDFKEHGDAFMGNRGMYGAGGNVPSTLNSEASASNHIISRISPRVRGPLGVDLANSYDTYRTGAQVNPNNRHLVVNIPKKYEEPTRIFEKLREGFQEKVVPRSESPLRSAAINYETDKRMNAIIVKSKGKPHNIYPEDTFKTTERFNQRGKMMDKIKKTRAIREFGNIDKANRATLIQNAAELTASERVTALREIAREIADTRKLFGKDVARSYGDQFRTIAKQVSPIVNLGFHKGR